MRAAPILICFILFSCSPPPPVGVEPEPTEPLESDAGSAVTDAGHVVDAGPEVPDAGTETTDGGTDAGMDVPDAGFDAGTDGSVDAGTDGGVDAGPICTCSLPSYCVSGVCIVDATSPVLTVTASAGAPAGKLRVAGTARDMETGITSVSVRINQAPAVTLPVSQGTFAGDLDTTDSEFTVVVTGRDAAGNEGSAQATFDPAGPRITLTPADGACDSSGVCTGAIISTTTPPLTITATVSDLALASTSPVTIRVVTTGGSELVPLTDLVRSGSSWTWTWANPPTLDATDVDFIVTATDAAQNVSSATVRGLLDRVGPPLTVTPTLDATCDQNGCAGAVINATNTTFAFSGTADATQLSVRVRDGASIVVPSVPVPITSGAWSWTWGSAPLADGRFFSAEFTATDLVGNTTSVTRIVLVDRVLPSLLVGAPATGALVGSPTVAVTANAADGLAIKAVEVTTQPSGPITAATLDANGDYVAHVGVPVVDAVEQTLTIRAVDLAGNTRTTTRRYVADRVAPVVSIAGTDFDCSGAQCTGMVARAGTSSLAFGGTATDGSAITLQKSVFDSSQVATSTDPVTGGAWSWSWASLPAGVNGAAYELRVVATDAAGNASPPSVRRVWLDNVAPTVAVIPAGQRNVSPTSALLSFSEPMVVDTVLSGSGFSPPAGVGALSTIDKRIYGFTGPTLAPYTSYRLVVASATDLAGNGIAAQADATFFTAPVARDPVTVVRAPFPGFTYRYPVVAVDSDRQIYVSYSAISSTTTWVESMLLLGTGTYSSAGNSWNGASAREGELRIVSESRGADQRLTASLEHSYVTSSAAGSFLGYGVQNGTWQGDSFSMTFLPWSVAGTTVGGSASTLDQVRPTVDFLPYSSGLRRNYVAPNNGATVMLSHEQNGAWSNSNSASLTSFRRFDGRASVEAVGTLGQFRVRFYDFGVTSEVGTFSFVRAATGQPALKRVDSFFGAPTATSGSFVAFMNDTQLTVTCSPAPFAATPVWRSTALSMPPTQTSSLTSTKDSTRVLFASEFGGNVHVHSTPLNGCAAAPVLTSLGVIPGLKDPNIFIDAAGTVWVAGIAIANGAVMLHRL